MSSNILKFCEGLSSYVSSEEDLVSELYDLIDLVENESDISSAYDSIFNFFESNPNAEIGSPGPLVHFIEKSFPNYVPNLLKSLGLQPTNMTVFMANRIVNAEIDSGTRKLLLNSLKEITLRSDVNSSVRDEAKGYLEFQSC